MRAVSCRYLLALACGRPSQMNCYVPEVAGGGSSHELHQSLSFQLHPISQDTSSTSGSAGLPLTPAQPAPSLIRLQEPFCPARPNHSSLLFPRNSVCLQGGYCLLQAPSSAPEQLGTLEPLLSQGQPYALNNTVYAS